MAEETPRRASAWGIVIAVVITLVASIVAIPVTLAIDKALLPEPSPPAAIALFAAETILVPLAIWLVFFFVYRRHRTPRRGLLTFLILLAITVALNGALGAFIAVDVNRKSAARAVAHAAGDATMVRTVLDESNAAASALNVTDDTPIDLHTGAPGEPGRIARGAKAMLRGLNAARDGFNDTAHALDYPALMAPRKLDGPGRLEKALTVFARMRTALALRDTGIETVEADYRALLAGARIDPTLRKDAVAYLDHQIVREKSGRVKYDALTRRILDELTAEIRDLQASRPVWSVRNDAILFAGEGDYARYNRHQHAVSALARELQALTGH